MCSEVESYSGGRRLCSTIRKRSSTSAGSAGETNGSNGGERGAELQAREERHQTSVKRFRSAGDSSFFPKSPAGFIVAHTRNPFGACITQVAVRVCVVDAGCVVSCSLSTKHRSRGSNSNNKKYGMHDMYDMYFVFTRRVNSTAEKYSN